jgi:hypothetical protein
MSKAIFNQDGTGRIYTLTGYGVLIAWGNGLGASNANGTPINGAKGFAPSCLWFNPKGTAGTLIYANTGTVTSATWTNII